jgi:polyisoprenoid-binding protein YceI
MNTTEQKARRDDPTASVSVRRPARWPTGQRRELCANSDGPRRFCANCHTAATSIADRCRLQLAFELQMFRGMRETTIPLGPENGPAETPLRQGTREAAVQAVLAHDHERLERQFQTIVSEVSRGDPLELRGAWRAFEVELLRHFENEELRIFPAFAQQRPADARALLADHERIRASLTRLGLDLGLNCMPAERISDFVDSLRAHARREDDLLYPWAAHRLSDAARERIREEISKTEEARMSTVEEWNIDLAHSTLGFSLRHLVIHEIRGQFGKWGGAITLQGDDLEKSTVRLWIDLATVDTNESARDDQLRSPEFFDVERFPQATFSSTGVRLSEHRSPVVKGHLDLHGFSGEVDLEIVRHNRWTDRGVERLSYEVRTRFDRRKFGLRWNQDLDVGGVVVGDEIEIVAQIEAVRVKPAS